MCTDRLGCMSDDGGSVITITNFASGKLSRKVRLTISLSVSVSMQERQCGMKIKNCHEPKWNASWNVVMLTSGKYNNIYPINIVSLCILCSYSVSGISNLHCLLKSQYNLYVYILSNLVCVCFVPAKLTYTLSWCTFALIHCPFSNLHVAFDVYTMCFLSLLIYNATCVSRRGEAHSCTWPHCAPTWIMWASLPVSAI